ncbi:MAG: restriction endonuclease subunit S [Candidatus Wallbacteria bacterium]|nr:restriction endonuclease subunit S [Candidatus Wallbacteria bacterium]
MSEWKECKLGDVAELINGFAFKSEDFSDRGIPVIKIKNVATGKLVVDDIQFYPFEVSNKLKQFILGKHDILIAMTGSHIHQPSSMVGKVTRYDKPFPALLNQRVGKIFSKNSQVLDEDFLYYLLKQDDVTFDLALNAGGSANQANISSEQIRNLPVYLPPISEQRAIASVLSSLDDKIDLLHRQNKILEGMAEALWRKMFVEEAAPGWKKGKLGDEMNITMGQSPSGSSYNENGNGIVFFQGRAEFDFRYPQTRLYCTEPKRYAKKFDTLVSVRAPVGDINMAAEDCCIGRGLASVRHKKEFISYTFYKIRSLKHEFDTFEQQGTVFGSIGKDEFNGIDTAIPEENFIHDFEKFAGPIDSKIFSNSIQILSLSTMRDKLLLKLMNGEMRVKNTKKDKGW